ncbi:MAG: transforming growth factor-beta-induced protein [Cyclobacteriaceae bacterium]|jgi:transforming growth factor-beta-induced protein
MKKIESKINLRSTAILSLFILSLAFFSSCDEDEVTPPTVVVEETSTDNIVEIASATSSLSTLVSVLTEYPDLVSALSGDGNFTVFAPTNAAFDALLPVIGQTSYADVPKGVIERILKYHVVTSAAVASSALTEGQAIATFLDGETVTVTLAGGAKINGAAVITADVAASNGIVHLVDAVLVPSLELSIVNTVVEPAYFNNAFSILTAAVIKADLLSVLIDMDADLTVFAPNDDAFVAAGITTLEGLEAADLAPILTYHVLDSEVKAAGLPMTGSAITTLNGDIYLSINSDGVFLNGTTEVIATDIDADNGVVHVINRTLVPAAGDIVDIAVGLSMATEGAEFGQLVAALTAVSTNTDIDLIAALKGDGPFTVFAPTDAAFQTLYDAIGDANADMSVDINDLVEAAGLETIATVLQYHVYSGAVFSTDIPNVLGTETSVTLSPLAGGTWMLNSNLTITPTDAVLSIGLDDAAIVATDVMTTNGVIHAINQVILP